MNSQSRVALYAVLGVAVAMIFGATPAAAEGSLDSIVDLYRNSASSWGPTLRNYALGLFGILALIEVGYSFIKMAIRGADLGDFLGELVGRMMFIGFFLWLLLNSGQFSEAIINSFRQAGDSAAQAGGGSGGVRPSDIFEAGMEMATRVMDAMKDSGWGLEQMGEKIMLGICAIIIAFCFALMAAFLILALVEAYIVMSAGTLLLGFGGSRFTKDFAIKQMTYCVSVGAKLFVIQLLVGIGEAMIKSWADNLGPGGTPQDFGEIMVMLGSAVVMVALTKTIPDTVQGIINGVSPGSGAALPAAAAAVAGAGVGAAATALGGGAAVGAASKLASAQSAASGKGGTGFGAVASHMGQMGKNLAGAARDDMGARLGGQAQRGTAGGRMAQNMSHQAKQIDAERSKPIAPQMQPTMAPGATPQAANDGGSIRGANDAAQAAPRAATATAGGNGGGGAPGATGASSASPGPIHAAAPDREEMLSAPQAVSEPIRGASSMSSGSDNGVVAPQAGGGASDPATGATTGSGSGAASAAGIAAAVQSGMAGGIATVQGAGPAAAAAAALAATASGLNAKGAENGGAAGSAASGEIQSPAPGSTVEGSRAGPAADKSDGAGASPQESKPKVGRTAKGAASAASWPEAPSAKPTLGGRLSASRAPTETIRRAPRKPVGDGE